MASQDKNEESSSLWASQTGPWDAILEAVREQLPSLDSDSSLSDCGPDELFIFQRDQTALIPDLSEELAEDPVRAWLATADGPPEPGVVSVELTAGCWSKGVAKTKGSAPVRGRGPDGPVESSGEASSLCQVPADTPTWQEGNRGALSFSTQGPPQGPYGEATFSPWEGNLKTESPGAASQARWGTDSTGHKALRRERRKMIEKDILHKVTWNAQGPACSDQSPVEEAPCVAATAVLRSETTPEGPREGPPVLSLKELEEWDLDHILQSLAGQEGDRGDRAPRATWWAADRLGRGLTLNARAQMHPHKQLHTGPVNKIGSALQPTMSAAQASWSQTHRCQSVETSIHSFTHSFTHYIHMTPLLGVRSGRGSGNKRGGPSHWSPPLTHTFPSCPSPRAFLSLFPGAKRSVICAFSASS